jgi:hypothetical protein
VDTLLTLVIALGGIATGIGAIWAAMLARRQARLTERSLAQTERSLAEQVQTLREQNEQARFHLEADILLRVYDRYVNPFFLSSRSDAAKHVMDNFFADEELKEVEYLNTAAIEVGNFFEQLGHLQSMGAVSDEAVWGLFSLVIRSYWTLYEPAIKKLREEWQSPEIYSSFERLNDRMAALDRERGVEAPTNQALRAFMEEELALKGRDTPTTE